MLKKSKWLIKEAKLRITYMTTKTCIFCKIVEGEIKSEPLKETACSVAINDINPVAQVHILVIPKKHIDSVSTITEQDSKEVIDMFNVATQIAQEKKLSAYRLAFNVGKYQHVPHLHMHLLAGEGVKWNKL